MRFGLSVINAWPTDFILKLAVAADKAGWDGVFLWDHVFFDWFDAELVEPWTLLGAIAALTKKTQLGTLVTPLARRRPHIVAKQAATLDHISKGRAILGVGLGGSEREFSAFGEDPNAKVRAEKLDEALEVVTKLWKGKQVKHHGKYFEVDNVAILPTPFQKPRVPIWVGGNCEAALHRAIKYDGWAPVGPAPSASSEGLEIEALKKMLGSVRKRLRSKNSFDVVFVLEMPDDAKLLKDTLRRLQQIGVTWAVENLHGLRYSQKGALARVRQGPPKALLRLP